MTTNHDTQTAAPPLRRITTAAKVILAAGAIALGAMSLTPAMANADTNKPRTEKDIKSDCASANGLYGSLVMENGDRHSECSYTDAGGYVYVDSYTNGTFTGTQGPYKPNTTHTPPPRATAILPPGLNTRTGTQ
jgi:hypothetical protein